MAAIATTTTTTRKKPAVAEVSRRAAGSKRGKAAAPAKRPARERRTRQMVGFAAAPRGTPGVAAVRGLSNLSQDEFARLTGYSTRAVAGWEAGRPLAQPARRRFAELRRLLTALSNLMPPGQVGHWLREPNEAFEGQPPMHVIERGEGDRLWQMIHQIDANVAN